MTDDSSQTNWNLVRRNRVATDGMASYVTANAHHAKVHDDCELIDYSKLCT